MKNAIKSIRCIFTLICICLFAGNYTFAQETANDTLPESAYQMNVPKHVVNVYSDFVPYVLFGIIIALILYVSYRYWHDNRNSRINHTPHHQ